MASLPSEWGLPDPGQPASPRACAPRPQPFGIVSDSHRFPKGAETTFGLTGGRYAGFLAEANDAGLALFSGGKQIGMHRSADLLEIERRLKPGQQCPHCRDRHQDAFCSRRSRIRCWIALGGSGACGFGVNSARSSLRIIRPTKRLPSAKSVARVPPLSSGRKERSANSSLAPVTYMRERQKVCCCAENFLRSEEHT